MNHLHFCPCFPPPPCLSCSHHPGCGFRPSSPLASIQSLQPTLCNLLFLLISQPSTARAELGTAFQHFPHLSLGTSLCWAIPTHLMPRAHFWPSAYFPSLLKSISQVIPSRTSPDVQIFASICLLNLFIYLPNKLPKPGNQTLSETKLLISSPCPYPKLSPMSLQPSQLLRLTLQSSLLLFFLSVPHPVR